MASPEAQGSEQKEGLPCPPNSPFHIRDVGPIRFLGCCATDSDSAGSVCGIEVFHPPYFWLATSMELEFKVGDEVIPPEFIPVLLGGDR
ncbi:hypothetical protein GGS26DRAFT_543037 [Hypomontagnella submonticulosa]|nr:hypothetical protein GGS26DRAFT_543037 [Hypomontagnella submonticulosa]